MNKKAPDLAALVWSPGWWIVRLGISLLHVSLFVDIGVLIFLACIGIGLIRHHIQHESEDETWGCVSLLMLALIVTFTILFLAHVAWIWIPAPGIPTIPLEPFPWPPPVSWPGALGAVGLSLLAHLIVMRRYRTESAEQQLPFSRAHQDGSLWAIIEQALMPLAT